MQNDDSLMSLPPPPPQVLEEYWKDWERCKASNIAPVKFQFSDDKKVQGNLSSHCGEGWKASLIRAEEVRRLNSCMQHVCHVSSCHVTIM